MKCLKAIFFVFVISLFCKVFVFAQNHPNIEPVFLPEDVLVNPKATSLTADQVFELSLLFSECSLDSAEALRCINQFEDIKAKVTSPAFMELGMEERGRAVLKLLYEDYLTAYSFNQTRVNEALQTGVYNCVSSALLYMAAAKAAGLDVRGQKTTEHAFCSIYVPGSKSGQLRKIDVETTNPYGFNPGSREEIENEDKIKGYYVVPKKYYANRQEVSDKAFAGLIAGNICSYRIEQNDYKRAVPLGAARYELVRQEKTSATNQIRRDFDVLAANYVNTDVADAARFEEYVNWYTSFIDRWGMTDFLQKAMDTALYNLLVLCFQEKDYQQAAQVFEKYKSYVTAKQITTCQELLADTFFSSTLDALSAQEQIELINATLARPENSHEAFQKRGQLYLENAWLAILNAYMQARDYEKGYYKAEEGLAQLPRSSKIKTMRQNFYSNVIAIIHNDFADQANGGNFTRAREILEEGLSQFPNDKTLKSDLQLLNKRTSN